MPLSLFFSVVPPGSPIPPFSSLPIPTSATLICSRLLAIHASARPPHGTSHPYPINHVHLRRADPEARGQHTNVKPASVILTITRMSCVVLGSSSSNSNSKHSPPSMAAMCRSGSWRFHHLFLADVLGTTLQYYRTVDKCSPGQHEARQCTQNTQMTKTARNCNPRKSLESLQEAMSQSWICRGTPRGSTPRDPQPLSGERAMLGPDKLAPAPLWWFETVGGKKAKRWNADRLASASIVLFVREECAARR